MRLMVWLALAQLGCHVNVDDHELDHDGDSDPRVAALEDPFTAQVDPGQDENRQPIGLVDTAAPRPPNVLLIVVDDMGYADTETYAPGIGTPTPTLDRLAAEGVRFTNAYATAAMCGPSRAGIMTGRYNNRFGFEYNPVGDEDGIPASETTISESLQGLGLRTVMLGKTHFGLADFQYPTNIGFDFFYGLIAPGTTYQDRTHPNVVNVEALTLTLGSGDSVPGPNPEPMRIGPENVVKGPDAVVVDNFDEYLTSDLSLRAVDFIEHKGDEPFFMMLSYTAPHVPLQVPRGYWNRFSHIADEHERIYAAMIAVIDDGVAGVLQALDIQGVADDTLVIFASDNGCSPYSGACDCSVVRGYKTAHLDGGLRVPMLMRWPNAFAGGQVNSDLVSLMDIMPTAVAAAGGDPSTMGFDGVDLRPFLDGSDAGTPHDALFFATGGQATAVASDGFKLRRVEGAYQLHDLTIDPLETSDVQASYPAVLADMSADLVAWEGDMMEARWAPAGVDELDSCGEWLPLQTLTP